MKHRYWAPLPEFLLQGLWGAPENCISNRRCWYCRFEDYRPCSFSSFYRGNCLMDVSYNMLFCDISVDTDRSWTIAFKVTFSIVILFFFLIGCCYCWQFQFQLCGAVGKLRSRKKVLEVCSWINLERAWLVRSGDSWCREKILVPCGPPFHLRTWDVRFLMIMYFKSDFAIVSGSVHSHVPAETVCLRLAQGRTQSRFVRPDSHHITSTSCSAHPHPPSLCLGHLALWMRNFCFASYYGQIHILEIKDHLGLAVQNNS